MGVTSIAMDDETKERLTEVKGGLEKEHKKIFSFKGVINILIDSYEKVRCTEKVGEKREGSKET